MKTQRKNQHHSRKRTQPLGTTRRKFLTFLSVVVGGIGTTLLGIPVIGFLLAPLLKEEAEVWRPVGAVDDFPIGSTTEVTLLDADPLHWAGFVAQSAAWLRRLSEQEFVAFTAYCTHVGCPVRWLEGAQLFMCPCHGSTFYRDGSVASGPPPRPLARYDVRVRNGQVEIRTAPLPLPDDNLL